MFVWLFLFFRFFTFCFVVFCQTYMFLCKIMIYLFLLLRQICCQIYFSNLYLSSYTNIIWHWSSLSHLPSLVIVIAWYFVIGQSWVFWRLWSCFVGASQTLSSTVANGYNCNFNVSAYLVKVAMPRWCQFAELSGWR